jgi:hypothetical protein
LYALRPIPQQRTTHFTNFHVSACTRRAVSNARRISRQCVHPSSSQSTIQVSQPSEPVTHSESTSRQESVSPPHCDARKWPAQRALHAARQCLARRRNQRNRRQAAHRHSPGPSTARATPTPRPTATIPARAPPSFQPRQCPSPRSGPARGPIPAHQSRHPANRPGRRVRPRREDKSKRELLSEGGREGGR